MKEKFATISILYVDDEEMLRSSMTKFLRRKGFNVEEAGSGYEAIERLKISKYDLILSDMKMPNGDGLSILEYLKKSDQVEAIPIIFLTGFSETEKEALLQKGAKAVEAKPINRESLLTNITQILVKS